MQNRILIFALSLELLLAPTAFATQQASSWKIIETMEVGETLVVESKDGKQQKGKFVSATVDALTLQRDKATISVFRTDIQSIYRLVGNTRGRSTGKGALIGAGIGTGVGLILYLPARDDLVGWIAPGFGLIGTGIGAGVGAVFSRGQKKVLVYQD